MTEKFVTSKEVVKIIPLVDINVIRETLTRIGIPNKKEKILYPSCYVYQNFEDYYIVHFKSMFTLTRTSGYKNLSEDDINRKNSIIFTLKTWGMLDVIEEEIIPHTTYLFVLPFASKSTWAIEHKFNIRNYNNEAI